MSGGPGAHRETEGKLRNPAASSVGPDTSVLVAEMRLESQGGLFCRGTGLTHQACVWQSQAGSPRAFRATKVEEEGPLSLMPLE